MTRMTRPASLTTSLPTPLATRLLLAVAGALAPVALTAFLSIPYNLGNHPGEARVADAATQGHMT